MSKMGTISSTIDEIYPSKARPKCSDVNLQRLTKLGNSSFFTEAKSNRVRITADMSLINH